MRAGSNYTLLRCECMLIHLGRTMLNLLSAGFHLTVGIVMLVVRAVMWIIILGYRDYSSMAWLWLLKPFFTERGVSKVYGLAN